MKYARGTVLKFNEKALRILPKRESEGIQVASTNPKQVKKIFEQAKDAYRKQLARERMIVLDRTTVISYTENRVEMVDMFKTQDSFVEPANEKIPKNLRYPAKYLRSYSKGERQAVQEILKEFNIGVS